MANRRMGGYGGRPNFNSGPSYNNSSVNPWQGGNVPGNQFGGGGSSNMLSQLSEPQAQLAIALTKLLQPQQQVPSLLSMNTNPPMQSRGYGMSNYSRGSPGGLHLNRRQQMKPFSKMNTRNDGFKNNQMQRRSSRPQAKSNSKTNKSQRSGAAESKDSKSNKSSSTKAFPTKSQEDKITDKDVKAEPSDTTETSVKDTDDKSETLVKQENQEEGTESEDKIQEDNENSAEKDKKDDDDEDGKETENDKNDTDDKKRYCAYDNIPKELFQCFICQKRMWDAKSFENHIKGRAHQQMCEKVDDSYRIKADMMREGIRLAEEKNNIEMDRMKRLGRKTSKNMQLSRCAMCDLDFYGQLFVHRKSSGHQKLKQFLHPKCIPCNKEFPTRMEWDNHRHTPEHLKKKAAIDDKKQGRNREQEDGIMFEEECFIVTDTTECDEKDDPSTVLDITQDLSSENIQIPNYKSNRAVGLSLIEPVSGFLCKPCSKFFLTETLYHSHAQTKAHYESFINILHEKMAEHEKLKRKANSEEDDEGNWKRRKTVKEGENDGETQNDDGQNDDCQNDTLDDTVKDADKTNDGNDLYDPMECDNDDTLKDTGKNGTLDTSNVLNDTNDMSSDASKTDSKIEDSVTEDVVILENEPTPAKTKAVGRPQRATRGRKH